MRYQNWDVLLFPEQSRIPIQEFKTQCIVTKNPEAPLMHARTFTNVAYNPDGTPIVLVPVVTCFVESLSANEPFRVSIHSWEKPKPSRTLESLLRPTQAVAYEARVYVDGVLVVQKVFESNTTWPFVIDTSDQLDREGNPDSLRFPEFHQEIVHQNYWDAGEVYGRVRVVLAEGFAPSGASSFPLHIERFKDVVVFAFQHAPAQVLEYSAIAWPNAHMWKNPQSLPTGPVRKITNHEAHAHSPRKSSAGNIMSSYPTQGLAPPERAAQYFASREFSLLPVPQTHYLAPGGPTTKSTIPVNPVDDPFLGPTTIHTLPLKQIKRSKPSSDQSTRYTEMSGVSYRPKDFEQSMKDAAIDEIVRALSPSKRLEVLHALTPTKEEERSSSSSPIKVTPGLEASRYARTNSEAAHAQETMMTMLHRNVSYAIGDASGSGRPRTGSNASKRKRSFSSPNLQNKMRVSPATSNRSHDDEVKSSPFSPFQGVGGGVNVGGGLDG